MWCDHYPHSKCNQRIWVCFPDTSDYARFLNHVAEFRPYTSKVGDNDTMYGSIIGTNANGLECWVTWHGLDNNGVVGHDEAGCFIEDECAANDFHVKSHIWMPRTHLAYVEKRLQAAEMTT